MRSSPIDLIADIHVGNMKRNGGPVVAGINARCAQVLGALQEAVRRAIAHHAEALVLAGDLFHVADPDPQIITATARILTTRRLRVFVLLGNHDQVSSAPGDNALGPLALAPNIEVVETPRTVDLLTGRLLLIPFQPGDARIWLPKVVTGDYGDRPTLLVTHTGIYDVEFPRHLASAPDAVPVELLRELHARHNIRASAAGNWHSRRYWEPDVLQIGALAPTGFGNPGLEGYGTLASWTPAHGFAWEEIPGPRFVGATLEGLARTADQARVATAQGCAVYLQVAAAAPDLAAAQGAVAAAVAGGACLWGEAAPDVDAADRAARMAGAAARSAGTLAAAVLGYAEQMEWEVPGDREAVLGRAQALLRTEGRAGAAALAVRQIEMRNFFLYKEVKVDLPPTGIILVTGRNGVGKSTLVEAISFAAWGETLRETSPWTKGADSGLVRVSVPGAEFSRVLKGGRARLDWAPGPGAAPEWESVSKGTKTLEAVYGAHDTWRRTHVFSAADAANFAGATDSQRKRLLETVLGLDIFDGALKEIREQGRVAKTALTTAELRVRSAGMALATAEQGAALAQAAGPPGSQPDVGALEAARAGIMTKGLALKAELAELDRQRQEILSRRPEYGDLLDRRHAGAGNLGGLREQVAAAVRRRAALGAGICSACAAPIPPETTARLAEEEATARQALEAAEAAAVAAEAEVARQIREVDTLFRAAQGAALAPLDAQIARRTAARDTLREELAEVDGQLRAAAREREQRQAVARIQEGAAALLRRAQEEQGAAAAALAEAQAETRQVKAAETLIAGVRAHVLGTALAGVAEVANGALARLTGPEVRLAFTVEDDKLKIQISGWGGEQGYRALSAGQRRRVDVAILMGLARIAGGAAGGLLVIDECFDGLDAEGAERVAALLGEEGETRPVMIMSHDKALVRALPWRQWIQVQEDSTLEVQRR